MERFGQDLVEAAVATVVLLLPSAMILIAWIGQLSVARDRGLPPRIANGECDFKPAIPSLTEKT